MYDHIAGELVRKDLTAAVVRAGGVGYRLVIPVSTYEALPAAGPVELFTHLVVREDDLRLYGFATEKERVLFEILISASGVGPAIALAIMSGAPAEEFSRAVVEEDYDALSRIRGIGAKTARRIVAEIMDDMAGFRRQFVSEMPGTDVSTRDAILALVSLGYPKTAARKAIEKARRDDPKAHVDQLVRTVLSSAGG